MHPDNLEEFILDRREQFDDADPGPKVWDRIKKRPAPVYGIGWKSVAWRAAAVVAIFISSYVFFRLTDKQPGQTAEQAYQEMPEAQSQLVNDLKEAEVYYTSQIEFMRTEAIRLSDGDPGVQEIIDTQMVDLDQVYEELKRDLKDNTANEEVIGAMIRNYRIKLEVLEEILRQLRQSKESFNSLSDENEAVVL
jgi:hypothetical protein